MHTQTKSTVTHRTTLMSDSKPADGGRSLLIEAFDFIRSEKQVGKLTAQFGVGGSISSLTFEETDAIPQKSIVVDE
jgi:hypothetical protein